MILPILKTSILLVFYILSQLASGSQIEGQRNLIIDTDVAIGQTHPTSGLPSDIDDAFVIAKVLSSPQFKVLGLSTTFGNSSIRGVNDSWLKLQTHLGQQKLPWVAGAKHATSSRSLCSPSAKQAADFLAKILEKSKASILALGPLSNIACLAIAYPQSLAQVDKIYAIMGQHDLQEFTINHAKVTDFNFRSDPLAADILLNTKLKFVLFPFALTVQSLVKRDDLSSLKGRHPLKSFLYHGSQKFVSFWHKTFGEDGFHPWDSATAAYLEHKDWFNCQPKNLSIKKAGGRPILLAEATNSPNPSHLYCSHFSTAQSRKAFEAYAGSFDLGSHKSKYRRSTN